MNASNPLNSVNRETSLHIINSFCFLTVQYRNSENLVSLKPEQLAWHRPRRTMLKDIHRYSLAQKEQTKLLHLNDLALHFIHEILSQMLDFYSTKPSEKFDGKRENLSS